MFFTLDIFDKNSFEKEKEKKEKIKMNQFKHTKVSWDEVGNDVGSDEDEESAEITKQISDILHECVETLCKSESIKNRGSRLEKILKVLQKDEESAIIGMIGNIKEKLSNFTSQTDLSVADIIHFIQEVDKSVTEGIAALVVYKFAPKMYKWTCKKW